MSNVRRDSEGIAHVVALSGGKDSTAMSLRLAEIEPRPYVYVCTPTGDELPEMVEHWARLETLLGSSIIRIDHAGGLKALCAEQGSLPNSRMRFCTRILKLAPFRKFLATATPCVAYVGLRADEEEREGHGGELAATGDCVQRFPMREWGWDIERVLSYLDERGIVVPDRTDCARCFYQKLGEWWNLWKKYPAIFADAERDEAEYGHTYRSPSRDTWPAALSGLRAEFEKGRKPDVSLRMMEKRAGMCGVCTK